MSLVAQFRLNFNKFVAFFSLLSVRQVFLTSVLNLHLSFAVACAGIFLKKKIGGKSGILKSKCMAYIQNTASKLILTITGFTIIDVAGGALTPKFLEYLVILCLERRYPIQNAVASLKLIILVPQNFWASYVTVHDAHTQ